MKFWTRYGWRRFRLPARVGWLVVGGYGVAVAVVAALSVWDWQGGTAIRPLEVLVLVLSVAFAAGCAYRAARAAPGVRHRYGWLAMVMALVAWAVGEVVWAVYEVRPGLDLVNYPAPAEIALTVFPVSAIVCLLLLSDGGTHNRWRLVLDGVILAISLFVLSWIFVVGKIVREGGSSRPATLIYVVANVALMTTAILVWSRARPGDRPSLNLMVGGIVTMGLGEVVIVYLTGVGGYHTGGLVNVGRLAGTGMVALAALASVRESSHTTSPHEITSRARLWWPYLPLLVAGVVGMGHAAGQVEHRPMVATLPILVAILVAAVLARQFVVLVENQGLLSEVAREAFHDRLTGLANRAHFFNQLEQAVARRRREATSIGVFCLDLDGFKSVNDDLGHSAGDELLIRVAGRLTHALGETGTVARLGGDEFAVLIEGSVEESLKAAHRVLDGFNAPIVIDGIPLAVRPSIGLTVAAADSTSTVDELVRHADLAMYAAKREGGKCIRSFVPDLPFPYALPQLSDLATSALETGRHRRSASLRVGTSDTKTALAVPSAAAVSTRDQPNDMPDGIRWPGLAIWIALAVLTIGVIAYSASTVVMNTGYNSFSNRVMYPAVSVLAAGLTALRAYRVRTDRPGWILIAVGMGCWAVGEIIYAAWVPAGQSPSIADPVYLAFYPLVYAGLLVLMRARLKRVPIPIQLDSAVCGLVVAAVAAALTAGPIHAALTHAPATVLVGLVYLWSDLLLLAMAASMVPIPVWRNEFRWVLLVFGFILWAAADCVYLFQTSAGSYRGGTWLDSCWLAAALLVAIASWVPSSSVAPSPKQGLGSYSVPVACTIVALGVAVLGNGSRLAVALAALSLIALAVRFSVTFRDITALAESHKQAMTDELTTLPNRRSLATALTAVPVNEPSLATQAPSRRALLLLDLDEFREINDLVGRHVGDELLRRIAKRLSESVRREDLLARTGGDEFAILLNDGPGLTGARAQAGRLLEALSEPFALDRITVQVDASIAIALCPDHCGHAQELLECAETTMARAKAAKSKIAVYDAALDLYHENEANLVEELSSALSEGDELTCHYQPKINAEDGSVHSVEALLRWHHPSRGLLRPQQFLPAAERVGLMRKVANRAVNLALEQIQSWREQGISLTVAVNLSTTNLLDLDLVDTIERLLRTHGLPPNALIIELTESSLATDSARSRNTVAALRRLGVRISLDDYGTGWSSLARLQDISVDELKLDRVFVARLAKDPRSIAIVRSTVALAHSLGADLVAEGVEDEVTLSLLRQYGCTITQGFIHSPPLPANELQRWMSKNSNQPRSASTKSSGRR